MRVERGGLRVVFLWVLRFFPLSFFYSLFVTRSSLRACSKFMFSCCCQTVTSTLSFFFFVSSFRFFFVPHSPRLVSSVPLPFSIRFLLISFLRGMSLPVFSSFFIVNLFSFWFYLLASPCKKVTYSGSSFTRSLHFEWRTVAWHRYQRWN